MLNKLLNKKNILYLICGIFTSILNVILFYVLTLMKIEYRLANIITLIIVIITAYICNKIIVFKSKCQNKKELIHEIIMFITSRIFTLIIDYIGLIILVENFNVSKLPSKIIVTLIVIIINYFFCSKIVFDKKKQ